MVLNCIQLPAVKVVFHLLNRKLPKQDCLTMPEYTKRIYVFVFVYKTSAKLHFIFDIQFPCFFAELQMAKSHFARWHLKKQLKIIARGPLGEPILIGEPSGNPGEPSGNPSPSQGNSRGTHSRETLGHRRGSQISSLDSNLKSHFKIV